MRSFEEFANEVLEEIRTEEKFEEEIIKEIKAFNTNGYNLLKEYENSLLEYWKDGHGEMLVLISEMQGFLDCLTKQNLIEEKHYIYLIDNFKEKLTIIRK